MIDKRIFVAVSFGLATSACGLVTGLSQDYTFDRDDASADGSATPTPDSAPGVDATAPDAAKIDAGRDAALACPNAPARPDKVKPACYDCVLESCCSQVRACASNVTGCTEYLVCVDDCGQGLGGDACRARCGTNATAEGSRALALCTTNSRCAPDSCHK